MLGVKSTFLVEPESEGLALLFVLGVLPAFVYFAVDSIILLVARRVGRSMDFRPLKVGNLDVKLGLLGLERSFGIAGSGFDAASLFGE